MFSFENTLRVRYAETDRMGYVYYGNYASFFEVARVEALRSLGMSYKHMEDEGFLLPVMEYKIKYLKPAFYDDELTIKTQIPEMPTARMVFTYEVFNQGGEKISEAETTLVFINKESGRPCKAPEDFIEAIKKYFV